MSTITIELDNLTAEEQKTVKRLAKKKKLPYFVPEYKEIYYYLGSDGSVCISTNCEDDVDGWNFSTGNCFRTKEEAEEAKIRLQMQTKWKRLSLEAGEADNPWDGKHEHWAVCFNNDALYYWDFVNMNYGTTYFPSLKSLEAAIAELGEENVKKYILGVE